MDDPIQPETCDGPEGGADAPIAPAADAFYFDGRSSHKRSVTLALADRLEIFQNGELLDTWAFKDIRRADGPLGQLRLKAVSALPLARLTIVVPGLQQAVMSHCPSLDGGHERHTWRIVGWSLAAATSVVLLVVFAIPFIAGRLAAIVPLSVESRIGQAADRQVGAMFGQEICNRSDGVKALQTLLDKLTRAGNIGQPLKAQVLASNIPNAFALPGGKVYVLNGLLQKAENPDEIAGVLAHELGHVVYRDSLRVLIQNGGTSYLVGLLFGDVFGSSAAVFATRTLFGAAYSRDVERNADAFAIATMRTLGRSPKPMADLLFRATGPQARRGLDIISTHPLSEERLATMSREDRSSSGPPLLSDGEWRALKSICAAVKPPTKPDNAG